MMHNKNIYKKLCTATISLGLLFSIGQFAYAHDPNLYDAEKLAASNPTLENLTHLRSLYKMDIKQHYAKGENDEAKEAEQKLQKTQAQIKSILEPAKHEDNLEYQIEAAEINAYKAQTIVSCYATSKNYALLAQYYDAVAELANTLPKYSEKAIEYQIKAAEARAHQLDEFIHESARNDRTAEQYETLAQRWDALAELAKSHQKYSENILNYKIYAAIARKNQQAVIIVRNGRTPGNYETLAQRYDEISQSYNLDGQYADAIEYKRSAIGAMLSMVDLTKDFNEKCNAYERAIAYNDDAATFAEASGWPHDSVAKFKKRAAESRIKLSQTILEHESTLENYDNWVRRWEELVQLFDEYEHNGLRDSRILAATARVNAAQARAKRAQFIAEQHETVENYDMLMQCWNEVAELSEIVINEHTPEAFLQYEVVEEARREAELAMDKRDFAAMIRQSTFLSIAALLGKK